MLLLSLRDE